MFDLQAITRPAIRDLQAYSSARDEFSGKEGVFLDANENPYGTLNRYPDPYQQELKTRLAAYKGTSTDHIFVGNGSDEVIDLAFRIFCQPRQDRALTFSPTYGMYQVSAAINEVELTQIPLDANFQINLDSIQDQLDDPNLKLIFICSPNNPTGNLIDSKAIEHLLENFKGILLIDEAYIDFSDAASWHKRIEQYPNLIVSQTFSKAWGLAAARVGVAYAQSEIIRIFNKVKPPYNVSQLNQTAALRALDDVAGFERNRQAILEGRTRLKNALLKLQIVQKIYPSDANFLLLEVTDAPALYTRLVAQQIIVRNRNKLVRNCLRISIGTIEEQTRLLAALQEIDEAALGVSVAVLPSSDAV